MLDLFKNLSSLDLGERAVLALERIANALERGVPPHPENRLDLHKRGIESVTSYGQNSEIWRRQEYGNLIHKMGLAPEEEQALLDALLKEADEAAEKESQERT